MSQNDKLSKEQVDENSAEHMVILMLIWGTLGWISWPRSGGCTSAGHLGGLYGHLYDSSYLHWGNGWVKLTGCP